MNQIHFKVQGPTKINVNNVSVIKLAKHPITHGRSKYIDLRFHFLRDQINKEEIELVYCKSSDQITDILTKPLKFETFIKLKKKMGMTSMEILD